MLRRERFDAFHVCSSGILLYVSTRSGMDMEEKRSDVVVLK